MESYFFRRSDWEELYNCSYFTTDRWSSFGHQNVALGVYCILFGVIFSTVYVSSLVALVAKNLQTNSCYRIMLVLGHFDVLGLLINSFFNGSFLINGFVFCSSPRLIYIIGCVLDGVWAAEAALSVLLAVNRCADFWRFPWFKALFDGTAINYWLLGVVLYAAYFVVYPSPPVFSSVSLGVWMIDPSVDLDLKGINHESYSNWLLLINNSFVVVALPVLYTALVLSIRFSQTTIGKKKHHMQVAVQALMICMLNFFSAFLYVYMHFLPTHRFLYIVCLVGWQGSSGSGGVIYLIFNKSIRKAVLAPCFRKTTITNNLRWCSN
ncbi:hypothetical protein QR680_015849 [Steinernema hermaphroditum]|uniref:Uncharacterized protein n=1 Tax=Steinernema hermaphroditum TaxID=289476 RepID=A0AA39H9F4_9BILA|nr:hypothetical protein QR680_015849 [Steinernema hermaphroditum]